MTTVQELIDYSPYTRQFSSIFAIPQGKVMFTVIIMNSESECFLWTDHLCFTLVII